MEWWEKQSKDSRRCIMPKDDDLQVEEAMQILHTWIKSKPDYQNTLVWARGNLDQLCYESLLRDIGIESPIRYSNWRDIRTALEFMYPNSKNGYVDIDKNKVPDYDPYKVLKHNALHDCALDACQLFGGIE